ncbi:MAG: tRNA 2-thiocytidine biosynthesis TtcA family protein [Bacilli bacterium]
MKDNNALRSIITTYRKDIWKKFNEAINEFSLIEDNDVIGVCISGGKDSFLLSLCMEELRKYGKINFKIINLLMDPGYDKKTLDNIKKNAKLLNINLTIFKTSIFDMIKNEKKPCYLCARKRRGALYSEAMRLGCNKIALGHHFNDVIETIIMSIIYNGKFKTMRPLLKSNNFENMTLIRPLYYVREESIIRWMNFNKLNFINCACKVTKEDTSSRETVKNLIKYINSICTDADSNILTSTKDVNLETLISYRGKDKNE